MQQQLLVAFMLLASVDFGVLARRTLPNDNISRIIGGSDVPPGEYVPYQVSVQLSKKHNCGGSIISRSHVLTAGHCCDDYPVEKMSVLAGVRQLDDSNGLRVPVKSFNIHEKFKTYKENDICILHLERDLPLDGVRFAAIAFSASEDVGSDVPVTLTGWGFLDNHETKPNTLQMSIYHTITNQDCEKFFRHKFVILETHICATGPKGSACGGDSGSPLVMSTPQGLRQVGIHSFSLGCRNYSYIAPSALTRVSKFVAWIQKHMN